MPNWQEQEREYHWLHIRTGKRGTRKVTCTLLQLLINLATWNRLGAGVWQYWL